MIIKCPECGHQVSDKAPVCPSCGVEIAGHIIKCSNCGELYLKEDAACPNCHHTETEEQPETPSTVTTITPDNNENQHHEQSTAQEAEKQQEAQEVTAKPIADTTPLNADAEQDDTVETAFLVDNEKDEEIIAAAEAIQAGKADDENKETQKKSRVPLVISLLITVISATVLLLLYNQGTKLNKTNDEQDAYEQAMASGEPTILQSYLKDNPTAPKAHRDSVNMRLKSMQSSNDDWSEALAANTKEGWQKYLTKHPNAPQRKDILAKIDEMDWQEAVSKDNEDAYLGYKAMHPDGVHNKEADEKLKVLLAHVVSDGERQGAISAVRQFLQGINSKSSDKISGAIASSLNFLGAGGATVKDIQKYMSDRLYQADVKTINWHLGSPVEVTKDSNDEGAELKVRVPATLEIEREGGKTKRSYTISAVVKDGKITRINW